jgi:hypothetical protein
MTKLPLSRGETEAGEAASRSSPTGAKAWHRHGARWLGLLVFVAVSSSFSAGPAPSALLPQHPPRCSSRRRFQDPEIQTSWPTTPELEYFNTHINALHSRKMMAAALEQSGLAARADFLPGRTPEEKSEIARQWGHHHAGREKRMINCVEHPDPQLASDLANALARAYIQQDLKCA